MGVQLKNITSKHRLPGKEGKVFKDLFRMFYKKVRSAYRGRLQRIDQIGCDGRVHLARVIIIAPAFPAVDGGHCSGSRTYEVNETPCDKTCEGKLIFGGF